MQYKSLLQRAYNITINNPILWMFGLFLSGGFNLNLLYIATLMRNRTEGVMLPLRSMINQASWWEILAAILLAALVLIISNWLKTVFLIETHSGIHSQKELACALCLDREHKPDWISRLPKFTTVFPVLLASVATAVVTVILALPLNFLISHNIQQSSPIGFSVTMLASLVLFCVVACWNMFTALYIVLHKMPLQAAAKAAVDLIVLRAKNVFEYAVLLLLVYGAMVVVGSVLIVLSQFSLEVISSPFSHWVNIYSYVSTLVQVIATVGFWVWLAVSNAYFNICLVLFFTDLVKPVAKDKQSEAIPATPVIS